MLRDYAVAPDESGKLLLHRADCPVVRQLAADGVPVMTLFGCDPASVRKASINYCDCLKPQ